LRILAISDIAVISVYAAVSVWFRAVQYASLRYGALRFVEIRNLDLLFTLIGQTGFLLALTTGIVAIVACLQRQESGWAAVFITLVVVSFFGPYFSNYLLAIVGLQLLLSLVDRVSTILLAQLIVPALLAVLVLVFTYTRSMGVATP
jgi:hypothetical protein